MKDMTFLATLCLGSVMVALVVSVGMMGWTAFKMAGDTTNKADAFFGTMKTFVLAPTALNVLSMALLGVMVMMG